ncbi:Protein CBR-PQN-92 [Caenorhabditis briggsae]|uniref:Protein CBR-PQN-92 n=1 Tax=Caenorhabditis briggsae TaxID=6238 RepID=A8XDZ4_CAEBR|nr:Protein CBR-PQN-92 [Caenorhabditis briggsae]CAP30800.2 Protein CBR-PQN-92 [Caenorhabditis briggsae]
MSYTEGNLPQGDYFYGNNSMDTTTYYPQQYQQQNYNQNFKDPAGNQNSQNFGNFKNVQDVQFDYIKQGQVQSPQQYTNQMVQSSMSPQQWKQAQDFQKAQHELLGIEPMGDGQMDIPEGPLSMCSTKHSNKLNAVRYSAKCLEKKQTNMKEKLHKANESRKASEFLEARNDEAEDILEFAVKEIVMPNFDMNNCNYDMYYGIEAAKEKVLEDVEKAKKKDEQLQQKKQTLREVKANLDQRQFENDNKNTIPVYVVKDGKQALASKTTIATRLCRAKKHHTTSQSDYDAAVNQYFELFRSIRQIGSENAPEEFWQRARMTGQIEKVNGLQEWLKFNPG